MFAINKNDFKVDAEATIDLADNFTTTKNLSISDIQTIDYFDGVFIVEGDRKDDYQIARSIIRRLEAANTSLETCIIALNNKDETGVKYSTAYLSAFFSEESSWGVSTCGGDGGFVLSNSLPTFKVDAVTRIYPDVQEQLTIMISNVDTFIDNVESKDYDTANKTAINLRSDFQYFKEYFNVENLF